MIATRPHICTAVGILSRYLHDPKQVHWDMLLCLLQYLNSTCTYGISYCPNSSLSPTDNATPVAWSDADFANDPIQARSISGFVIMICNGSVVWYSKKQSTTAQSTAEAEYIALNMCTRMVVWLRQFLHSLDIILPSPTPIHMKTTSVQ
jgi:hypothetical protein